MFRNELWNFFSKVSGIKVIQKCHKSDTRWYETVYDQTTMLMLMLIDITPRKLSRKKNSLTSKTKSYGTIIVILWMFICIVNYCQKIIKIIKQKTVNL